MKNKNNKDNIRVIINMDIVILSIRIRNMEILHRMNKKIG